MQNMIELTTPLSEGAISQLEVGDVVSITGNIFCGRDAVLPRICKDLEDSTWVKHGIDLKGGDRVAIQRGVKPIAGNRKAFHEYFIEDRFEKVSAHNAEALQNGGILIACGMARFEDDKRVADVLERADRNMYENKNALKAAYHTSTE